ncbi:unnamed protein product [Brachionus calyciflorus]|uniref:Uncharacterized protein n=1 Tax=Brachionus calyciflorus TaxID=104777 RepID=A0A814ILT5_9BILA|nr:unnamed protein product [Brachionus calyciflorus]
MYSIYQVKCHLFLSNVVVDVSDKKNKACETRRFSLECMLDDGLYNTLVNKIKTVFGNSIGSDDVIQTYWKDECDDLVRFSTDHETKSAFNFYETSGYDNLPSCFTIFVSAFKPSETVDFNFIIKCYLFPDDVEISTKNIHKAIETRKFQIKYNKHNLYNQLIKSIQSADFFGINKEENDGSKLKTYWLDEDNDLIRFSTDKETEYAFNFHKSILLDTTSRIPPVFKLFISEDYF